MAMYPNLNNPNLFGPGPSDYTPIINEGRQNLENALLEFSKLFLQKYDEDKNKYLEDRNLGAGASSIARVSPNQHRINLEKARNYFNDNYHSTEFIKELTRKLKKSQEFPSLTVINPFTELVLSTRNTTEYRDQLRSDRQKICNAICSDKFRSGNIGVANSQAEVENKNFQKIWICKLLNWENSININRFMGTSMHVNHNFENHEWFFQGNVLLMKFTCELLQTFSDKKKTLFGKASTKIKIENKPFIKLEFATILDVQEHMKDNGKGGQIKSIGDKSDKEGKLKLELKENCIKMSSEPQNFETKITNDGLGHYKKTFMLYRVVWDKFRFYENQSYFLVALI